MVAGNSFILSAQSITCMSPPVHTTIQSRPITGSIVLITPNISTYVPCAFVVIKFIIHNFLTAPQSNYIILNPSVVSACYLAILKT